jgi:uncharacterized membrane protein
MVSSIQIQKEMIMNKINKYLIWPVLLAPAVYAAIVWNKLPERLPMHYNMKGEVDRYGSKSEMLLLLGFMILLNLGVYFLLINIHRIDPKKKFSQENLPRMKRLAFFVSVFLSAVTCFIIYSSHHGMEKFDSRLVIAGVGLLFTVMGNYMYNIKPNYFAGIRTPWALENEENWRLTHKLAGKLWFVGGLILAGVAFLLPDNITFIVLIAIVVILSIIPIVYSYQIYSKQKKVGNGG